MKKDHEKISIIFLIVSLLLILFFIFLLFTLKSELKIESLFTVLINTTSHIKPIINIQNIYPNTTKTQLNNASIVVYLSQFYYNYHLRIKITQGKKVISSIPLNYYSKISEKLHKINSSTNHSLITNNSLIRVFKPRQMGIVFTKLNPFTVYNITIIGTITPICTQICPMGVKNVINTSNITINSSIIKNLSTGITSSSMSLNSLQTHNLSINSNSLNSSNSLYALKISNNITSKFIRYIHKYELIRTNANGTIVSVYFSI